MAIDQREGETAEEIIGGEILSSGSWIKMIKMIRVIKVIKVIKMIKVVKMIKMIKVAIDQTGGRGNYWQRNFIISWREVDQDDQDGGENFH